jgi:hypothetical protein
MSDGTDQSQRLPVALAPGYFKVDELTFEQRVSMSAAHAARLHFYDLTNQPAGSWRELFDNDAALVMARIISIDARTLERQFARDLMAAAAPQRLAAHTLTLAGWLDLWVKSLQGHTDAPAQRLLERMEQLVELQLRDVLREALLRAAAEHAGEGSLQQRRLLRLDARWRVTDPPLAADQRSDEEVLRTSLHTFISAIEQLQGLARELLPAELRSASHEPAAGLLLAFLQLFQLAQGEINQLTARHTDFYYRRCLRMLPRAAVADSVHLVCSREPHFAGDVLVARGTPFAAGKDAEGQPIEFVAEQDLLVTDARVAALHTLHFECDPLISPEREFGFVTRAKAQDIPVLAEDTRGYRLFGAGPTDADARLGLAIAAPVLLLHEGLREIRFSFSVAHPDQQDAWASIVQLVVQSESVADLHHRLGRLFSRWLLSTEVQLDARQLASIRATARRLLGERPALSYGPQDPLGILFGEEPPQRALIFDLVFRNLFSVHLTAAEGWHAAIDAHVAMSADQVPQLIVRLPREAPALVRCKDTVHGADWPQGQPLARIELQPQVRMYAYSLLSQLLLSEIKVAVSVQGVRDLVLYNNLGRLDATRTLYPFGPLPTLSSYLIVGLPEAAAKHLTALQLQLEWSGLPRDRGGFAGYYAGYDMVPGTEEFTVDLAILNDGIWQRQEAGMKTRLFAEDPAGTVASVSRITFDADFVRKYFKAEHTKAEHTGTFDYSSVTRNGFVRMQLAGPECAFGQAAHPLLLTRVVSDNARLKRAQPMPNPPYTPALERVVVDYAAEINISLAQDSGTLPQVRVLHLHPFGIEEIYQRRRDALPTALPAYAHRGNLLIGIAAEQLHGPLTLLFELRETAAAEMSGPRPQVRFAYLTQNRWHEMPAAQVLTDTTDGFLTAGIVTLDVPAAIRTGNTVLSTGLFWLRLAADHGFESFAGLQGIRAQALRARRLETSPRASVIAPGVIGPPVHSIPGLHSATQVGSSFGLRPSEDIQQLRTRTGERLQHKQRATTPWDYERLVLDRFNHIAKVKCFRVTARPSANEPSRIRVVVIPAADVGFEDALLSRQLNAVELQRIAAYLRERSSPCVSLEVRNAVYEYVQVRCTVQVARDAAPGMSIRHINRCIVEHLSPWHRGGYQARFDWSAHGDDVEAWIRKLDCVDAVSGLSLLHITKGIPGRYTLADTARATDPASGVSLRARSPYSILLPTSQHLIEISRAERDAAPRVTGVANLAIGNTFIIGDNS